jgi:hypothetical protein
MTLRAGGIDEETDLVAADVRILVEATLLVTGFASELTAYYITRGLTLHG